MERFKRALLLLCLTALPAAAEEVPLPRPRPLPLVQPSESPAQLPEVPPQAETPVPPPEPSACQLRLAEIANIAPQPPLVGPGECGAGDVVRLDAVLLADGTRVPIHPAATLRCEMAEAVAQWLREDMSPAAARLGASLAAVENAASYDCRGRNNIRGAKLSEHGKANALDVSALKLIGGRRIALTDPTVDRPFREALRMSACARFTTVLGPGSDGYHEDHIHVDIIARRGGFRMCQWDVRDPIPLPRERPTEAPQRIPEEDTEGEQAPP
jgi:hypothetical protein